MKQSIDKKPSSAAKPRRWHKPNDGPSSEDRALQRFADMLIEKISTFKGDWKKPWFTEGALRWPKNLSGREYNGLNALMLMMHCEKEGFKFPVFCTFDRLTRLNYSIKNGVRVPFTDNEGNNLPEVGVNKGAKSFPVFITTFTVIDKETNEKFSYDDFKNLSTEEQENYHVFPKLHVYPVFNIDQTNLQEARPELYKKIEEKNTFIPPERKEGEEYSFEPIDVMIKENLWICPIKHIHCDDAYYSISKKEIVMPEKSQFEDDESFYSNLFHEMAHSTGAKDQLNRLKPAIFGSTEYAIEELTAEMTAALVSQRYGMTKHLKENSAAYLKSWLKSLKEEPSYIKTVLNDVKKASNVITMKVEAVARDKDIKLDIREEETQDVVIDESGDAQLVNGESLGVDKKQGANEERPEIEEEETEERKQQVHRRWH